ncbi:MAG: hypothetical protein ACFFCS_04785 [Candidatus Hodarchaeota archaeon]
MEVYIDDVLYSSIGAIAFFIAAAISLKQYTKHKGKVLLFFLLTWIAQGVFLLFDAMSIALRDVLLFKIQYAFIFPLFLVFWMAFIDYATTDSIGWKKMTIAFGFWIGFIAWLWHPFSIVIIDDSAFPIIAYNMEPIVEIVYLALNDISVLVFVLSLLYWIVMTYRVVPESMKKYATILLVVGILLLVSAVMFLFVEMGIYSDDGTTYTLMYASMLAAIFLTTIVIYKKPKITYLLPYTVYRILVTSKGGTPYLEYNWSEHEVNTTLLAGLFSAISMMAKGTLEKIDTGKIKEVNFQNAIFLTETTYSPVNIGLLASKSSQDLKTGLANFSSEFVKHYSKDLYNDDGLPADFVDSLNVFKIEEYEPLINKHFGNVPNFVTIDEPKQESVEKPIA